MTDVTWHAKNRMKQRVGVPKRAVAKQADRAFENGITHGETTGTLRRYLDSIYLKEGVANNIRILDGRIYLFAGRKLITVYMLPPQFRKKELALMKKKRMKEQETQNGKEETIV